MDYTFPFGIGKKIYRVDDQGISTCVERKGVAVTKQTIPWNDILAAGECVMTSSPYERGRYIARVMTDLLPQGRHPEQFEAARRSIEQINGYLMIAFTKGPSERKRMVALPINVSVSAREAFLQDLSSRLGHRWLGVEQDPAELKKKLGVPTIYKVKGLLVFGFLLLVYAVVMYFVYFR